MRARAMQTPLLRPFYNVAATVFPLLIAIVLLAAYRLITGRSLRA